jgi:hypothetical protein
MMPRFFALLIFVAQLRAAPQQILTARPAGPKRGHFAAMPRADLLTGGADDGWSIRHKRMLS